MIRLLIAALAVCFAGSAWATTLTFDTLGYITPIQEKGYTYTNFSAYNLGGQVYLHDDGGQRSITISRVDRGTFSPISASVSGYSKVYTTGSQATLDAIEANNIPYWTDPWAKSAKPVYDNFTIEGIRNGQVVAYTTGYASGLSEYSFNQSFLNLTELRISLKLPEFPISNRWFVPRTPFTNYCSEWCAGFQLRDLKINDAPSPVPLPASGAMLVIGLLGFGVVRIRKPHQA